MSPCQGVFRIGNPQQTSSIDSDKISSPRGILSDLPRDDSTLLDRDDETLDHFLLSPSSSTLSANEYAGFNANGSDDGFFLSDIVAWREIASEVIDASDVPNAATRNIFFEQTSFSTVESEYLQKRNSAADVQTDASGSGRLSQEVGCGHGQGIDLQLERVMRYPDNMESHAQALSTARDGISQLQAISSCGTCTSSHKSMALIFIIANGLMGQLSVLSRVTSLFKTTELGNFHLGAYKADSPEECLSLYLHAVRFQLNNLAAIVDVLRKCAEATDWQAHSASWRKLAMDLRLR